MNVKLNQIGQIAVGVEDLERAVAFYRDTLGMEFLFQAPPGLAFFDCGGIRLMLDKPVGPGNSSILYYRVEEIEATTAALREKGVKFESQPHMIARLPGREIWMAFFRDSEGNLLAITSEVTAA